MTVRDPFVPEGTMVYACPGPFDPPAPIWPAAPTDRIVIPVPALPAPIPSPEPTDADKHKQLTAAGLSGPDALRLLVLCDWSLERALLFVEAAEELGRDVVELAREWLAEASP